MCNQFKHVFHLSTNKWTLLYPKQKNNCYKAEICIYFWSKNILFDFCVLPADMALWADTLVIWTQTCRSYADRVRKWINRYVNTLLYCYTFFIWNTWVVTIRTYHNYITHWLHIDYVIVTTYNSFDRKFNIQSIPMIGQ